MNQHVCRWTSEEKHFEIDVVVTSTWRRITYSSSFSMKKTFNLFSSLFKRVTKSASPENIGVPSSSFIRLDFLSTDKSLWFSSTFPVSATAPPCRNCSTLETVDSNAALPWEDFCPAVKPLLENLTAFSESLQRKDSWTEAGSPAPLVLRNSLSTASTTEFTAWSAPIKDGLTIWSKAASEKQTGAWSLFKLFLSFLYAMKCGLQSGIVSSIWLCNLLPNFILPMGVLSVRNHNKMKFVFQTTQLQRSHVPIASTLYPNIWKSGASSTSLKVWNEGSSKFSTENNPLYFR